MDVKEPLSYDEISFLYDSLKSDIGEVNKLIDKIAGEIKDEIKNLSPEDKQKLKNGEKIERVI